MKKYLIFLLVIIISCQKDEIELTPKSEYTFVFEQSNTSIKDGEEIYFNLTSEGIHLLTISDDTSVIAKESFNGSIGLNTKLVFTKVLPKQKLKLSLADSNGVITETYLTIE